jgi:hypothetical protein
VPSVATAVIIAFVASSPTNEAAYGHFNHLAYISKAYAVQQFCPRLVVNREVLLAVSEKYKIGFGTGSYDFSAMTKMMAASASAFRTQPTETVCAVGIKHFGPEGDVVRGLLVEK